MGNTISKNFDDSEIIGVMEVDGRRTLYLKQGVKRRFYKKDISRDSYYHPDQVNHIMKFYEKYEETMKIMYGGDDFSNQD